MNAIYSSKLYKISSRKQKINNAIQNPINKELVLQLKEYLETDDTDNMNEMDKVDVEKQSIDFEATEADKESNTESTVRVDNIDDDSSEKIKDELVEITADASPLEVTFKQPDVNLIKGTLNATNDTSGVSRVHIKDDELWIYYQDKVNLNSIMEPVIELLNGSNFNELQFNRLARTENAIVFEILSQPESMKPMVNISNE